MAFNRCITCNLIKREIGHCDVIVDCLCTLTLCFARSLETLSHVRCRRKSAFSMRHLAIFNEVIQGILLQIKLHNRSFSASKVLIEWHATIRNCYIAICFNDSCASINDYKILLLFLWFFFAITLRDSKLFNIFHKYWRLHLKGDVKFKS